MVPPPSPQQMPQTYYPYPQQPVPQTRMDVTALLTRRIVFVVVGIGGVLVWISLLGIGAFNVTDTGAISLLQAVGITGAFLGFGGCLAGGLGSKQTNDNQNLGLLILSGAFVLALNLAWRF